MLNAHENGLEKLETQQEVNVRYSILKTSLRFNIVLIIDQLCLLGRNNHVIVIIALQITKLS